MRNDLLLEKYRTFGLSVAAAVGLSACGGAPPETIDPGAGLNGGGANGMVGMTGGEMGGETGLGTTSGNAAGSDGGATTGTEPLGDGECAAIRRDSPEAKGGVDVVFLLDTSGSMLHATTQVQNNLANFIQEFEGTDADTRVVMITGSDPAAGSPVANQPDRYRFIQASVDSAALFTVALALYPAYEDFLRPDAATQFVMITDDNDAIAPADFESQMSSLLGKSFTQHAVASEEFMGGPCISEINMGNPLCIPGLVIPAVCGAAAVGTHYYGLADQTGGVKASVCKADWTEVFAQLRTAVIEAIPLPCDYPLADAVGSDYFNKDEVQIRFQSTTVPEMEFPFSESGAGGCPADGPGWYYDNPDDPKVIHLCPAACDAVEEGGAIDVVFGCPPQVLI